MDYKDTVIIILSVLLLVTISVLLYLIFGRGQVYFPTKLPLDLETLLLADTLSHNNNIGALDVLYDKNATIDEKQEATADIHKILNSRVNDIKNSTDDSHRVEINRLNRLMSTFENSNRKLRTTQIQSMGLDKPILEDLAMNASKFNDWMRATPPKSKYPTKSIGNSIYTAFNIHDNERIAYSTAMYDHRAQAAQMRENESHAETARKSKKKWSRYRSNR